MGVQINIKQGYDQRLKARIDERATRKGLLSEEAHHWPLESLEFAYAVACVEIALLHSEKASHIYSDIVRAWELPGCQTLIGGFKDCLPVTNEWKAKALEAREKGKPFPDLPNEWFDTYFKHAPACLEGKAHNTDWEYLLNKMNELILVGFNRHIDQDNKAWKVIPDNSPWLKSVIILRSQAEYCKVKLEDLNKYHPAQVDGKLYNLNAIMADKPTAGMNRKIYRTFTDTYQGLKFTLKHDAKLLKDADQWYKCRVNPGSIEQYISDESEKINRQAEKLSNEELEKHYRQSKTDKRIDPSSPGRSNVEATIAPYDEVTGYPRKWRK